MLAVRSGRGWENKFGHKNTKFKSSFGPTSVTHTHSKKRSQSLTD